MARTRSGPTLTLIAITSFALSTRICLSTDLFRINWPPISPDQDCRAGGWAHWVLSHWDGSSTTIHTIRLMTRLTPRRAATTNPDLWETTQFALSLTPDDFRPTLMLRTRHLLEQRAKPGDRVFGLWAELMDLPEEDFAAKAADKIAQASASRPSTNLNSVVLGALAKAPLTNKSAVARAYGQLLLEVYDASRKPVAGSASLSAEQQELLELVIGKNSPVWFPRRDTPDHMSRVEKDRYN